MYIMARPEWIEFFEFVSPHPDDGPRLTVLLRGAPLVLLIRNHPMAWV
jgi:hypothetical protein